MKGGDKMRGDKMRGDIILDKNKIAFDEEQDKISTLWYKYLSKDKRSFIEYFKEEHNIKLDETTSYKKIKRLCKTFLKGGQND